MDRASRSDLLDTIDTQREQLKKYEKKLRGKVQFVLSYIVLLRCSIHFIVKLLWLFHYREGQTHIAL
jgi:hypothetical protein